VQRPANADNEQLLDSPASKTISIPRGTAAKDFKAGNSSGISARRWRLNRRAAWLSAADAAGVMLLSLQPCTVPGGDCIRHEGILPDQVVTQ